MPKRKDIAAGTGIVAEVHKFKAIVSFGFDGKHEQALLKMDKLSIGGKRVHAETLTEVLTVGSVVKFWAHTLKKVGVDNCGWFITHAFLREFNVEFGRETGFVKELAEYTTGLPNQTGCIIELDERNGTISSKDGTGSEHLVYFTASKFFCFGKNFDPKGKLQDVLKVGDLVHFDAIPSFPENNSKSCEWFATLVWRGKRPMMFKKTSAPTEVNLKVLLKGTNYSSFLYQLCDAKASFVIAEGRIMFLIDHSFGVALLVLKTNVLQTAFFHKSDVFCCGHNMANCDLRKFFKEGDRVKFIGVEAPNGILTKFVAAEISAGVF